MNACKLELMKHGDTLNCNALWEMASNSFLGTLCNCLPTLFHLMVVNVSLIQKYGEVQSNMNRIDLVNNLKRCSFLLLSQALCMGLCALEWQD